MILLQTEHADTNIERGINGLNEEAVVPHFRPRARDIKVLPANMIREIAGYLPLDDFCSLAVTCKSILANIANFCDNLPRFYNIKPNLLSGLSLIRLRELQTGRVKVKRFISKKTWVQQLFHIDDKKGIFFSLYKGKIAEGRFVDSTDSIEFIRFRPVIEAPTCTDGLDMLLAFANPSMIAVSFPSGELAVLPLKLNSEIKEVKIVANSTALVLVKRDFVEIYAIPLKLIAAIPIKGYRTGFLCVPNPRKHVFAITSSCKTTITSSYAVKDDKVYQLANVKHSGFVKQMLIHQKKSKDSVMNFLILLHLNGTISINKRVLNIDANFQEIHLKNQTLIAITNNYLLFVFEIFKSSFHITGWYNMLPTIFINISSVMAVFASSDSITWYDKFGLYDFAPVTKCCFPKMKEYSAKTLGSYVIVKGKSDLVAGESWVCVANFDKDSNSGDWVSTFR